jgi:hypothetical protein
MFSRKSKIQLGKREASPVVAGSARGKLSAEESAGGALPASPIISSGRGGSLYRDRVKAREASASLNPEKLQVSPVILVAALSALVILLIALLFAPRSGSEIDNTTIIRDYNRYRMSNPALPPPEQILGRLREAELLENNGNKADARRDWEDILISSGSDPSNPLRDLAMRRLNDLK